MSIQKYQISANQLAVYDKMLLLRVVEDLTYDQFGQSRTIAQNKGSKKGFARRYKNMLPATTPLVEYDGSNIRGANKIVFSEVEYDIAHYGDYVITTEELDLYDFDDIESTYIDILGDQAALTVDTVTRDVLNGGTNVIYADGQLSRANVAANAKRITAKDLDIAYLGFTNQGGKPFKKIIGGSNAIGTVPIGAAYIAIASPEVVVETAKLDGWIPVEEYGNYKLAMPNEEGKFRRFRFIQNLNTKVIDESGVNVHLTTLLAKDAYATISLRGEGGIQSIVKGMNEGGVTNPLNTFGSFGWKTIHGAAIINEAWITRLESTVELESTGDKHYYDYS